MKSGFSKLTGIVIIVAILLSGCAATKHAKQTRKARTQSSQVSASSSSSKSAVKKPKRSSRMSNAQRQIRTIEQRTVTSASGRTSVYVRNLQTKRPVVMHNRQQRSASVIKLFIMIAVFRQIKLGRLSASQMVTIPKQDRVGGTGVLASQSTKQLSVNQLLTLMIRNSDNTATNVLIDQLGGLRPVNTEIQRLGCTQTVLQRKMLDYQALKNGKDNLTSVADVGHVLGKLYQHQILGNPYDAQMLQLLRHNANQSKIPTLINQKAIIYNKTGEFPDYGVQNDAAIVKKGHQAFVAVVLSENGAQNRQIKAMQQLGRRLFGVVFSHE
ncbi:serine hydrolase [Secundilactobacillus folii]|uniref:Serine hydrolase n=1 Tax=Secundilactobacillus folii TaxID=2678357 RepID=A0A7X2XVX7_9LACO|nr:serine hydrolase [Secundilactobacillus folii]MTV82673.1 serine hydrolase [Secundilactobacillus folii]